MNPTAPSGAVIDATVRFGAVSKHRIRDLAARCGLQIDIRNPTVWFGYI